MNALYSLAAAGVFLTGCNEHQREAVDASISQSMNYPTIAVDLDHHQTEREDGKEPGHYSIQPSSGLILDTTGYQPQLSPQSEGKECNSVQLIMGDDRQYSAEFDPAKTRHVLDATTLTANPGSKPFSGIQSGDSCIVAVGHMRHEVGKPPAFSVAWVSMANTEINR